MLLVKPSFQIEAVTPDALRLIERIGRVCYKSEDKITEDSHLKFVETILKKGHESVIEHASATVRFICNRGVSHEIVRHRIASYSQESTRYCDYNNGHVAFVIPSWFNIDAGEFNGDLKYTADENGWLVSMLYLENRYNTMRQAGLRPEQARGVLPNDLKTEIVMTCNLREWRHFFKLRTSNAAHPDMRSLARPLLEEFKKLIPVIFDDILVDK